MASIADISGGASNWGTPRTPMEQLAAAILATDTGGMNVQQNGYNARAEVPVAAGPAWAGPSPMPAYPSGGNQVTMPGSRAAYEQWGIPPIMMQSSPYATAAYRTYTDPYGQLGVQPLIGFPSAYPHVLSGVPTNPFSMMGMMQAMMPPMPMMWGYPPTMQMPQQPAAPSAPQARTGNPAPARRAAPPAQRQTAPTVAPQIPAMGGPYDETQWRDPNMPVPPAPGVMPIMTQLPPEVGGDVNTSPEAHAAGHAVNYPSEFRITPQGAMAPALQTSGFAPQLMTPEEAAATADGMYVDPTKSVWENMLGAMGAVSMPLSAGAAGAAVSVPRVVGGYVVPQAMLP